MAAYTVRFTCDGVDYSSDGARIRDVTDLIIEAEAGTISDVVITQQDDE